MNRNKKILLLGCGALLLVCIIIAGIGIWGLASIFSEKTVKPGEVWGYNQDSVMSASAKLMEHGAGIMGACDPEEIKDISFTEDEVNGLIFTGLKDQSISPFLENSGVKRPDALKDLNVLFKDGKFIVNYSKDTEIWTPFGKVVNVEAYVVPQIQNGELILDIKKVKLGSFNASESQIKNMLGDRLENLKKLPEYQKFMDTVPELLIDENKQLKIKYKPYYIREMLQERFMKAYSVPDKKQKEEK
jgi:hypothetical protein